MKRNTWMTAGNTAADQLEFTVTKLIDGNEYLIRVFAENEVGASEPVETAEPVAARIPFGKFVFRLVIYFIGKCFYSCYTLI